MIEHTSTDNSDTHRYVVVTTFGEQRTANTACAALEGVGIPVMLEHIHIREGTLHGVAYRLLVPLHFSQTALTALAGLGISNSDTANSDTVGSQEHAA